MSFKPTATGTRTASVILTDNAGNVSGTKQSVTLTGAGVASATAAIVSLTPASGSGASQAFSAVYSDTSGASDLTNVRFLMNSSTSAVNACYVIYYPASNALYLYNDAGSAMLGPLTPGSTFTTLSNSQCALIGTGSSATSSGHNLSVVLNLAFSPGFDGARNVYLEAFSSTGNTGLVGEGTYTVTEPNATLSPASLTFASQAEGVASAAQSVTLSNPGNAALAISSIALTGTNASDYAETNNCGTSLAAATSCTVSVTFTPSAAGVRTAVLAVTDNSGNVAGSTQTTTLSGTGASGLGFIPVTPCRLVDTRQTNGPLGGPIMTAGSTRSFALATASCGLPSNASAYSLNVTVVPKAKLNYLTLWATGQSQPAVSTLNSPAGQVVANAAIVPAGLSGAVSVYVTDETEVIIDVNGYFAPATASTLTFVPVTPCRAEDTRKTTIMAANTSRSFPIPSSACSIPSTAAAYSLNATVVPSVPLNYLTLYPTGGTQPGVSTLNSPTGQTVANAALVPAGTSGAVTAYVTNQTNLILDINGYFTSTPAAPLVFHTVTPCRVADTRTATGSLGGPIMAANSTRSFPVPSSACGLPSNATAYALNVTVVPAAKLNYLTLWPAGQSQPTVSTLNSPAGQVVANAALVPAGTNGALDVYVTDQTHVILDVVGYFSAQ